MTTLQERAGERAPVVAPRTQGGHRQLAALLAEPGVRAVVLAPSKDDNAKITVIRVDGLTGHAVDAVKVPTTDRATEVVEREARLLVAIRRTVSRGAVEAIPRHIGMVDAGGRRAMRSSCVPGVPMSVGYHSHGHTADRHAVEGDFLAAAEWLAALQASTSAPPAPVDWLGDVTARMRRRWPERSGLPLLLDRLAAVQGRLSALRVSQSVVHGDYWFGNLLVAPDGKVTGVVDWEAGDLCGLPLRDVARFPLSYALYLDRHTAVGRPVRGHRGLRAGLEARSLEYAVDGVGWFPDLVRQFVRGALVRLQLPAVRWRDVLVAGIAEIAASADHDDFAQQHLDVVWQLTRAGS